MVIHKIARKLNYVVVPLALVWYFSAPVFATSYTATSTITVIVNESTSFSGPGNWAPAAQAPNATYGPTRSSANLAWQTNALGGYTLSTEVPPNGLYQGTTSWTNHAGTIASPTAMGTGAEAWGFSLSNISGTVGVDSKWNNGSNYAAFPSTITTVYTSSAPDTVGTSWAVYWKAQSLATTRAGTYTTTATWTFSSNP